jgi:hypothetical protein
MPSSKEKALQEQVFREYRKKGYGKERAAHIARAVTYGPRKPKKRRREKKGWWNL